MYKGLIPVSPRPLRAHSGIPLQTGNEIRTARNRLDVATPFHLLAAPGRPAEPPLLAPAGRCPLVVGAVADVVGTFFVS